MKKLKKETKDKIFSVLKFVGTLLVEALWTLLVFAFGFCVGADKFAGLRSSSVMKASAESVSAAEVSTVSEETESVFDLTKYPSANLIPYPCDNDNSNRLFYVGDEYTLRGVIFRFNIDGSISLFGTSTESFTFVFVSYKQFSLPVGFNYCISGGKDNVTINCWKRDVNGTSIVFASSANGNVNYGCINDGESFYRIGLSCKSGYEYNTTIYPMLNVGEVAYPYSPSFDLIYNQGYAKGEESGYEEGKVDGAQDAYDAGLSDGFDLGYSDGYFVGSKWGFEDGFSSGKIDGYSDGLKFGLGGQGLLNPLSVSSVVGWGILDVENTLFVQMVDDGLVAQSRSAEAFAVGLPGGPLHGLLNHFLVILDVGFLNGGFCAGQLIHKVIQRGIQIEIDAEQSDDPLVFAADGHGGAAKRFSGIVDGMVSDEILTTLRIDPLQHLQGQFRNGGAFLAAGMETVDHLNGRAVQIFQ